MSSSPGAEAAVDLWVFSLAAPREVVDALQLTLDAGERDRAARFVTTHLADYFVVAHAALRHVLAGYLGTTPAGVAIDRRPCTACGASHGKPIVGTGNNVRFSLAHSGARGVLAVTSGVEVGVDVEEIRGCVDLERTSRLWLSPAELHDIASLPLAERNTALFRRWTRKEAVLKGSGDGFSRSATAFSLERDDQRGGWRAAGDWALEGWYVRDVDIDPRHQASVATLGSPADVTVYQGPFGRLP